VPRWRSRSTTPSGDGHSPGSSRPTWCSRRWSRVGSPDCWLCTSPAIPTLWAPSARHAPPTCPSWTSWAGPCSRGQAPTPRSRPRCGRRTSSTSASTRRPTPTGARTIVPPPTTCTPGPASCVTRRPTTPRPRLHPTRSSRTARPASRSQDPRPSPPPGFVPPVRGRSPRGSSGPGAPTARRGCGIRTARLTWTAPARGCAPRTSSCGSRPIATAACVTRSEPLCPRRRPSGKARRGC